jgi:RNA polymerase sigma-70 factor (ECF subfamily)
VQVFVESCPDTLPVPAAREGQSEAWDALFKRFQLPLYSYVYECLRDEQTSLDIVQETFINAVKHIRQLREDGKFGSWLFGIAHQKIQQHRRKQANDAAKHETFYEQPELENENPLQWLIRREDEKRFMDCVEHLSPPHRSVLLLHFIEGFKLDEIAEITNAQTGTVKSRLFYAKKALRNLLKKELK